jgi:hypothetical protein
MNILFRASIFGEQRRRILPSGVREANEGKAGSGRPARLLVQFQNGKVSAFGARRACYHHRMKVEKNKFDTLLGKLISAKPEPRKKIKTQGRKGSKSPILSRP